MTPIKARFAAIPNVPKANINAASAVPPGWHWNTLVTFDVTFALLLPKRRFAPIIATAEPVNRFSSCDLLFTEKCGSCPIKGWKKTVTPVAEVFYSVKRSFFQPYAQSKWSFYSRVESMTTNRKKYSKVLPGKLLLPKPRLLLLLVWANCSFMGNSCYFR